MATRTQQHAQQQTQPRQRDHARTRRALLDAARGEIQTRGVGVSLDAIARASGVSKGGLLHHFPSKDELLLALAEDLYQNFEAEVERVAEQEPATPGRMLRAYVRANFREISAPDLLLRHGALLNLMSSVPGVSAFIGSKLAAWSTTLSADGISPAVTRLVMLAADGAAVGVLTRGAYDPALLTNLEDDLINLIDNSPLAAELLAPGPPTA